MLDTQCTRCSQLCTKYTHGRNRAHSLQEHPSILSVDSFKQAVEDARHLMPSADVENMLLTDPDFVLSLQKGTDMIPYDAVPENPWSRRH